MKVKDVKNKPAPDYGALARGRAAKKAYPLFRIQEMLWAVWSDTSKEDESVKFYADNPDGTFSDPARAAANKAYWAQREADAKAFEAKYPNGMPLAELNAELKAYLTKLIAQIP